MHSMANDYKEKIRKLLALAESPNEHEAKAALLKARQLMAEHKLIEAELEDSGSQNVRNIRTDITCSKRRCPWIVRLSAVIAKNYCCTPCRYRERRKQTQTIGFFGLENDVEVCASIFRYAVDCILSEVRQITKDNRHYGSAAVQQLCNDYGYGFTAGLKQAFSKQEQENADQWGLILSIPEEVLKATEHMKKKPFQTKRPLRGQEYQRGYQDGQEFDPSKRLNEAMPSIEHPAM